MILNAKNTPNGSAKSALEVTVKIISALRRIICRIWDKPLGF